MIKLTEWKPSVSRSQLNEHHVRKEQAMDYSSSVAAVLGSI